MDSSLAMEQRVVVTELWTYPLKQCRGVRLSTAELERTGLLHDRRWAVVETSTGLFLDNNRRKFLSLIQPEVDVNGVLTLTAPELKEWVEPIVGDDWLSLPAERKREEEAITVDFKKGNGTVDCVISEGTGEGGRAHVSAWIERLLIIAKKRARGESLTEEVLSTPQKSEERVVLVRTTGTRRPALEYEKWADMAGEMDVTSLSWFSPLHLINAASMRDLNARLKASGLPEVGVHRFRPNIVVDNARGENSHTLEAFDEDLWSELAHCPINGDCKASAENGLTLFVRKPTHRCTVTTLSESTGGLDPQMQPLKHLRSYRMYDGDSTRDKERYGRDPLFGLNVSNASVTAVLSEGDVFVAKISC